MMRVMGHQSVAIALALRAGVSCPVIPIMIKAYLPEIIHAERNEAMPDRWSLLFLTDDLADSFEEAFG